MAVRRGSDWTKPGLKLCRVLHRFWQWTRTGRWPRVELRFCRTSCSAVCSAAIHLGHLFLLAGHLLLAWSKLTLIGIELVKCVLHGGEISRDGLKPPLDFVQRLGGGTAGWVVEAGKAQA